MFNKILRKGIKNINKLIKKNGKITGYDMAKYYETYGFPVILTKEICETKGINVDMKEYEEYMKEHKEKSKKK